jgi:hypothetical protein
LSAGFVLLPWMSMALPRYTLWKSWRSRMGVIHIHTT